MNLATRRIARTLRRRHRAEVAGLTAEVEILRARVADLRALTPEQRLDAALVEIARQRNAAVLEAARLTHETRVALATVEAAIEAAASSVRTAKARVGDDASSSGA